jgi:phosphogluconate dehydratase
MSVALHPVTAAVTARIVERSRESRADYLARIEAARHDGPGRAKLSCANWAHAFAASPEGDKQRMRNPTAPNVAIVSAYNDMLSAHQPLERFPALIKIRGRRAHGRRHSTGRRRRARHVRRRHARARPGMELSLFSRDVIAHGHRGGADRTTPSTPP